MKIRMMLIMFCVMAASSMAFAQKSVRRLMLSFAAALALLAPTPAVADDPQPPAQHQMTVMSRNAYHGVDAEILAIPGATSFPDLLNRVADAYLGYHARNFPERARALAVGIETTQPALIGLQEAVLVRTGPLFNPAPAETVDLDYVQILLDALAERGLHYAVIAENRGFDFELPSSLGFDVRHTDREVILARTDMPPGHLQLSNAQTGDFAVNCVIPSVLFGPIPILRGWASVDVWSRGRTFRFISTHLDGDCLPFTSAVQVAQAGEVRDGPADTLLPVVLAGDVNASPLDPVPSAYQVLADAGYGDAWSVAGSGDGFTCCQADNLLNPVSILDRRIDVVLFRGNFDVHSVTVTGDDPADRTISGLWPSDHAGVAATLAMPDR
jgi:hypothetical protein